MRRIVNFGRLRRAILAMAVVVISFAAASPQNTPAPAPSPTPGPATRAELLEKVREAISRPEFRRGRIGIKVVSLASGAVVFEQDADKYFMPASNMKNFTVAAAIEKLSPEFRFVTSLYAAEPVANGVVKGPLRVFGRGDISVSYSFNDEDHLKGIDRLADAIVAAGIKRVEGDIIGDESYFRGSPIPPGWEWDDLQFYYGAEVSALPINDNVVGISVLPGPAGYQCSVELTPANLIFRVSNNCRTTAAGATRTLRIEKKIDRNQIEITGDLPLGDTGFRGFISVSRPAEMFVSLLKQRLASKGVEVTGRTYALSAAESLKKATPVEIARLESPSLALIAAKAMKPSQNMYTETLLWTLGEEVGRKRTVASAQPTPQNQDSHELGRSVVREFIREIGLAEDELLQYDGSGLSRHNLVTPAAVAHLYHFMARQSRNAQVWRESLTIGGVDGTLRNRFKGTRAEANVRGKTGTINQVSALSGYLTTAGGEQLVFSMIVNGVQSPRSRVELIDQLVLMLVNFEGKLEAAP